MLNVLRNIVEEVSNSKKLSEALSIITQRIQRALAVDAVSIYLRGKSEHADEWVLSATEGLNKKSIGKIKMREHEGLVGLVAKRAEAMNLDNASSHARFKYFPESGESIFQSFLGVPIIHYGQVNGVLVVQQRTPRLFDEDQVAFLITLAAQLAGAIAQATINQELSRSLRAPSLIPRKDQNRFKGLSGSPGIAIGEVVVAYPMADLDSVPDRSPRSIPDEIELFQRAVTQVKEDMKRIAKSMLEILSKEEAALFEAYELMLDGGPLISETIDLIRSGNWAQGSFRQTIQNHVKVFQTGKAQGI